MCHLGLGLEVVKLGIWAQVWAQGLDRCFDLGPGVRSVGYEDKGAALQRSGGERNWDSSLVAHEACFAGSLSAGIPRTVREIHVLKTPKREAQNPRS